MVNRERLFHQMKSYQLTVKNLDYRSLVEADPMSTTADFTQAPSSLKTERQKICLFAQS